MDHSEILNFEFDVANKERSDHMNRLVYKSPFLQDSNGSEDGEKENSVSNNMRSADLFKRLSQKEIEAVRGP